MERTSNEMKTIDSKTWIDLDVLEKMVLSADVFRGFLRLPDGTGEIEVELYLADSGVLEVGVYVAEPDDEGPGEIEERHEREWKWYTEGC